MKWIDLLTNVGSHIDHTGKEMSKLSPTQMMKYQFGMMLKIAGFAFMALFLVLCFVWWESNVDRREYVKSIQGFHSVLVEMNTVLKQRDAVLEKAIDKVDKMNTNIVILDQQLSMIKDKIFDTKTSHPTQQPNE